MKSCINFCLEEYPANWILHGQKAGPLRNSKMVELGASVCLAFPSNSSRGTWDCARKASRAGIPVTVYWPNGAIVKFEENKD